MNFFTTEQLSDNMSKTPEGFLLCRDVAIARTGVQIYGPYETPVPLGNDARVKIIRDEAEVFRKETVDSFAGKPVVDGHPVEYDEVNPSNWKKLSIGVVLNPQRGTGDRSNLLVADLLITDAAAIEDVLSGKREVSCGYDAKYEVLEPGLARQRFIVGNHVALVDKARCGAVCSIQDSATRDCCGENEEVRPMSLAEKLKKAFGITDEKKLNDILAESAEGKTVTETHVHVHTRDEESEEEKKKREEEEEKKKTKDGIVAAVKDAVAADIKSIKDSVTSLDARMKAVEDAIDEKEEEEEEEEEETEDAEYSFYDEAPRASKKTLDGLRDSKPFEESFQETIALAEVIQPGVTVPTFDAKLDPKKTVKRLCDFRRKVLDSAYDGQGEVKQFMDSMLGGRDFKTYDCRGVSTMFSAVGTFKKKLNNDSLSRRAADAEHRPAVVSTIADRNKKNAEFYK